MAGMSNFEKWFLKIQFSGKARIRIYRKLARYISNGVTVREALEAMLSIESKKGKNLKTPTAVAISAWLEKVREGKYLGNAIEDWVPKSDAVVIRAGEKAGKIAEAIENACLLYEGQKAIKGAIFGGLAYPIVLIMMAVGFMVMFGLQVIPAFDQIMPKEKWTGISAQMAAMSDFVFTGLAPTIGVILGLIAAMFWSMPRWTGKVRAFVDNFAPFSIYRLMNGSGFLLSLAALVKAGVKVSDVLSIMGENATPWYSERISRTLYYVRGGSDIGEALDKTGLNFPDAETVNDLKSYAKLSSFDEALIQIGKQNLDDSVAKIKAQTAVLRNVGIVALGLTFCWIAMGIFDLQTQITQNI